MSSANSPYQTIILASEKVKQDYSAKASPSILDKLFTITILFLFFIGAILVALIILPISLLTSILVSLKIKSLKKKSQKNQSMHDNIQS